MKKLNFFVATIGKRDLQLKEDLLEKAGLTLQKKDNNWFVVHEETGTEVQIDTPGNNMANAVDRYFTLRSPRIGGEIIKDNDAFKKACDFPIVRPVLDFIMGNGQNIDEVKLVYTDQKDIKYRNSDTLHFSGIMHEWINNKYNIPVDEYGVSENLADIDFQYDDLKHKQSKADANLLPPENQVNQIFLLPQGGMDQINFPLTLRLIENYREKLQYIQKTEDEVIHVRNFPEKFIKNLTRNQAIELIKNGDFQGAKEILISETLQLICQFAIENITLNYPAAEQLTEHEKIKDLPFIKKYREIVNGLSDSKFRQLVVGISALYDFSKKEPNNLLWKLRTLGEILLLPEVEEYLELESESYDLFTFTERVKNKKNDKGKSLEDFLKHFPRYKSIFENNELLIDDYKTLDHIYTFKYKGNALNKPSALEQLRRMLEKIRNQRNDLLHKGFFITLTELENALIGQDETLENVFGYIENFFVQEGIPAETFRIIKSCQDYCIQILEEDNW
jgi:hypothetical protein